MSSDEEAYNAQGATREMGQIDDPDDNTLRIMLSTDNHLGYNERDPVRGMDSFAAFEEVLYLAKRFHCDMVLIAGDLFHHNKPSRSTLFKAMEIIRRYCMGDNPVRIRILSDQQKNFPSGVVNYQDPHFSVDLPIFSIHGNHDDPTREGGKEALAALDLLSVSNLVNYFGKQTAVDQVEVSPVLLQKGDTKLALYGLGSMRDERLHRMWNGSKVRFLRPNDDDEEDEDGKFFNIFALHQNRDLGRGTKNCVKEAMLPEWMDLVVWGHEHECLIEIFESVVGTFRITQPGSSVATSLVAGEAARKKVGILDIKGQQFRLRTIPLTQVRSFVTTEITLRDRSDELDPEDAKIDEKVAQHLEDDVRLLVVQAREQRAEVLEEAWGVGSDAGTEDCPTKYKLEKAHEVLVRIRVEHSGFTTLNNQRFGAKFVGDVANPEDILLFHRKKDPATAAPRSRKGKTTSEPIEPTRLDSINMEDMVEGQLGDAPGEKLQFFSEKNLHQALEEFVDKSMSSSIDDAADSMLVKRQKKLVTGAKSKEDSSKKSDTADLGDSDEEVARESSSSRRNRKVSTSPESVGGNEKENSTMVLDDDSDDNGNTSRGRGKAKRKASELEESDFEDAQPAKSKGRKSRASSGKGARTAPSDPKRKAARRKQLQASDDDSDVEVLDAPPKSRSKRSSRAPSQVRYAYDEDDEVEVVSKPKKRAAASTGKKKTILSGSTRKKPPRASTKFGSSDDDDFEQVDDDDLDADWGTANTRSQI